MAEYRFDENSGQTLTDYTGNGHDGQLGDSSGSDSADPQWNAGYLSFSGQPFQGSGPRPGTCVLLGAPYAENAEITFQLVVRGPTQSNQIRLLQSNWSGGLTQWSPDGSGLIIGHSGSGTYNSGPILDNSWHLLRTRQQWRLFGLHRRPTRHDGCSPWPQCNHRTLGFGSQFNDDPFNGDMAYLLVYDVELTQTEVMGNYSTIKSEMALRGIALP